jgi:hypothetical protein
MTTLKNFVQYANTVTNTARVIIQQGGADLSVPITKVLRTANTFYAADGSAAAPSHSFVNDTDTGIYRVGTNSIGFSAGGVKKVEVNSSGLNVNSTILLPQNGAVNWNAGQFTMTGGAGSFTMEGSSSTVPTYILKSNEAGATGVTLNLEHATASPAGNDIPALIQAVGRDSASNQQVYGQLYWQISDTTNGSEDATLVMNSWGNGTAIAISLNNTSLIVPRLLDISGASAGQIQFPASQNASAGANVLDDYEEGTWTPGITYSTPGNVSVVYSQLVGTYSKIGRAVYAHFQIVTSTFTHTTASGNFSLTGLPFTPSSSINFAGSVEFSGMTMVGGSTTATLRGQAGSTVMLLIGTPGASGFGSGQHTSGTNVAMIGSIHYHV